MKTFEYTYPDIAEASGKTEGAVRVDIARKRFDPLDLKSTAIYIVSEMLKGASSEEGK